MSPREKVLAELTQLKYLSNIKGEASWVFIVCGLIWYFWSTQLKWFFIFVRRYETKILSFFVHNENTNILNQGMNMVRPDSLTWDYATKISDFIGGYLMYPSIFILLVLGIIIFRSSASMRYTKAYSMDTLVHQEKSNWPQISPVADLNLIRRHAFVAAKYKRMQGR